jgi:hypothetical protein
MGAHGLRDPAASEEKATEAEDTSEGKAATE